MVHPLQTKEWGEFRSEWGNEIIETDYGNLTAHKIPLTQYKIGIFEKGPTPNSKMFRNLKEVGLKNKLIFIKLEPNVEKNESAIKLLKDNAVPGKTLFTPTTFWIDLTPSEDELLKSFSSKTRYNIRLAQKHGVKIQIDNSNEAFEKYLELTSETNKRQGFYSHTPKYHRLMWKHLKGKIANLLTATYKQSLAGEAGKSEIISTWVLFNHDEFLYYPYGASTDKHKEVMANNLMMWEAIKFGKSKGLKTFDLWGREEGKGFTKFKEGYNPRVVEFLGSWDLVINKPLYYTYRLTEKIRWLLLRLKSKI